MKWYKIDNAAKIFIHNDNKNDTKVFRFSVCLKESIQPKYLQEALNISLQEYPSFHSIIKKGFFWYYLDEVDDEILILEENKYPCSTMDFNHLFRLCYYQKWIHLEVFHVLTDGTGALSFLKSILFHYLSLQKNIDLPVMEQSTVEEKMKDDFNHNYDQKRNKVKHHIRSAYHLHGECYPHHALKVIEGKMNVKDVLKLAQDSGYTLTEYLTSILIESIGECMPRHTHNKQISISIPVNLRKYYGSKSARNFFNIIQIQEWYESQSHEQIVQDVKEQFQEDLKVDNIYSRMNSNIDFEKNIWIRLVPLAIKNIIMRIVYQYTMKFETMTISNMGKIDIPSSYQKYIDSFSVCSSSTNIHTCMITYQEDLMISFSTHFVSSEIAHLFFEKLVHLGVSIEISTNSITGGDNHATM